MTSETEIIKAIFSLVKEGLRISPSASSPPSDAQRKKNECLQKLNQQFAEILCISIDTLKSALENEKTPSAFIKSLLIEFLKTGDISQKHSLHQIAHALSETLDEDSKNSEDTRASQFFKPNRHTAEGIEAWANTVKQRLLADILFSSRHTRPEMRSPTVLCRLKSEYDAVPQQNYVYRGESASYGYTINGRTFTTDTLIESQLKQYKQQSPHQLPMRVLDLGPALGRTLNSINQKYPGRVECHGLDAQEPPRDNPLYHQGNVEDLSYLAFPSSAYQNPLSSSLKFQVIFTSMLFMHLVDPAGALIQAFDRLEENGILVTDHFSLPGYEGYVSNMIDFLRQQGHVIIADTLFNGITGFIIQKTSADQKLNLSLVSFLDNVDRERMRYTPIHECLKPDNYKGPALERAQNVIFAQIQKLNIVPIIDEFKDLISLINSQAYKDLSIQEKYFALLGVAVKNFTLNPKVFCDLENLTHKIKIPGIQDCLRVLDRQPLIGLFDLDRPNNFPFRVLELDQKLSVVKYVLYRDIAHLGRREIERDILSQMGHQSSKDALFFWENECNYTEKSLPRSLNFDSFTKQPSMDQEAASSPAHAFRSSN